MNYYWVCEWSRREAKAEDEDGEKDEEEERASAIGKRDWFEMPIVRRAVKDY